MDPARADALLRRLVDAGRPVWVPGNQQVLAMELAGLLVVHERRHGALLVRPTMAGLARILAAG